jgi:alginate O-acetyltransferase complex protein AlgI
VLLADKVAPVVSQVFAVPAESQTAGLAWLGIVCFTLQIYFDFAGYTDMAIGLGKMCGFDLPENFNYPYMARSIRDFWARWHISLAQWLRDYLFLPVAYAVLRRIPSRRRWGIKAEDWAYYLAAPATMTLCGLWHGASWNFVFWGAFFGVWLVVEHAGLEKRLKRLWLPLRILYTQLLVQIAWVFFRAPDFPYAFSYLKAMFGAGTGAGDLYYPSLMLNWEIVIYMAVGIIAATPLLRVIGDRGWRLPPFLQSFALTFLFVWSIVAIANGTYNPFIYFRF